MNYLSIVGVCDSLFPWNFTIMNHPMALRIPLTRSYVGISLTPSEMVNLLNTGRMGGDFGGDDEFVQELLSDHNTTGDFRDFVLGQKLFYEWRDAGPHPDGKILKTILNRKNATEDFLRCLRGYVDEWLNTGKHPDGSECPDERDVSRTRFARLAAASYIWARPPLFAGGTQSALVFQSLESFVYPVTRMSLARRERQGAHVSPKGPLDGQHLAAHFFTQLVLSAWSKTICKCRYERCGEYFLIEKPRAVYKWGTRHRVCSNKASAIRKFHQDRKTMQDTKLDLARKAVLNLKAKTKTDRSKELKHKIVAQMNRGLHRDARVTVKWVTRHWKKITVSGGPHATRSALAHHD